ncbi:citrulline utilization hydrolase CtlX [Nesterenkonia jeotgali]|uniref:citrulline utilization hydrolase CtlX n=1 Tax=Nesterenkonia jeotgali TaxID=317018 RepID=UPI0009FB09DC|nr:arginine deiminase-related protein [Nesterenkonia jeotgali]
MTEVLSTPARRFSLGNDGAARVAPADDLASPDQLTEQSPSRVVLVRPHQFTPNPETAADNSFQQRILDVLLPSAARESARQIAAAAYAEVTRLGRTLEGLGIGVDIFDDPSAETPDSVFPNNWFSTHPDGTITLYPMYAKNRRAERREDILAHLQETCRVRRVVDYSSAERFGEYLEGTGSMVLDHRARLAYACRSRRLSPALFTEFCADFDYTPVLFDATDGDGVPVYHTNVMMSVGTDVALISSEMIRDRSQREHVLGVLRGSGRTVVELSESQVGRFAGNCLELAGSSGRCLVLSTTAEASLTDAQRDAISAHCTLVPVDVSTLEAAGGSVRCMIAGNHLPRR